MAKAVFCIAKSEEQATQIVNQLKEAGFSNDDVSVLLPDRAGSRDFAHEHHTKAPEGAAAGAGAGGVMAGGFRGVGEKPDPWCRGGRAVLTCAAHRGSR